MRKLLITLIASSVILLSQARKEKPSPFTPRTSEPPIGLGIPVSPIVVRQQSGGTSIADPGVVVKPTFKSEKSEKSEGRPQQEPAPVPEVVVAVIKKPERILAASDLREITIGSDRDQVINKLGAPASRIAMFEDGHLEESIHYDANRVRLGTIRLIDGKVTAVQINQ